ncbi:MAG: hypothetical protein JW943_04485 [Deltaproteobacteria bacterium]|nr:hypothetical protein [Deltaproteobacteria bacterium]
MWHFLAHAANEIRHSNICFLIKRCAASLCIVSIMACAAPPIEIDKSSPPGKVDSAAERLPIFRSVPSDIDYLRHGIMLLLNSENTSPDYAGAKKAFESILKEYPDSKWNSSAIALIKIINDLQMCTNEEKSAQNLYAKTHREKTVLIQENERLIKANNVLADRLLTEVSKLVQENDRLKKDIELLKDLEIKLDRRERLLK